jgi:hypothetical protein
MSTTHMCDIKINVCHLYWLVTSSLICPLCHCLAYVSWLKRDVRLHLIRNFSRCDITVLLFNKARKMCPLIFGHFPLERQARPLIMVLPCLRWLPLLFLTPMLIMQQCKLHFSHTPCKTRLIVSDLPIRLYAVRAFPHYSKQSDAATLKGAPI